MSPNKTEISEIKPSSKNLSQDSATVTLEMSKVRASDEERELAPPSKFMRLGSGLSNTMRSAALSCFDLELYAAYAETVAPEPHLLSEDDLSELFGIGPDKIISYSKS